MRIRRDPVTVIGDETREEATGRAAGKARGVGRSESQETCPGAYLTITVVLEGGLGIGSHRVSSRLAGCPVSYLIAPRLDGSRALSQAARVAT